LGIAYGTKDKKFSLMRFANRTPLLFDTGGCLITKSLKKLHWSRYEIKDIEQEPISIFINLISPHIPYTSTGKQSIAEDEDLGREIRNGLMELGRKIKKYLSQKRREREQKLKKAIYLRYIPLLAKGLSEITSRNKSQLEDKLKALISAKLGQEDNK
jgi:DNA topoisomerase-6 subunit B